jgi:GntR family transcriptional regulator/MocR family aminotransferase
MPAPPPLPVDLSGLHLAPGQGLARQLYQALRERILDGRLRGGTRLPASRDLAALLGVSRNTVVRAFDQLYAEGYLQSRVGDGSYVAALEPSRTPPAGGAQVPTDAWARLAEHYLPVPLSGPPRAFRLGVAAFDLFPFDTWARLQARFWRRPPAELLGYGEAAGHRPLRELIATYLRNARGLDCDPQQIVITCGAQQGIGLCAQLLVEPGDGVAVENPGYRAAAQAFAAAGARLHGVSLDADGLDPAALPERDCRLLYLTPSHQYPTGVTLPLARRLALLDWAERVDGFIVEDDYDGEYRYSGVPLAPLAALDRQGRVIYVGTFSKIAFPALRLGYLVLPPALVERFARRRGVDMRHSDVATQAVMAQFIADGHFQRHIRRMRQAARARRDALLHGWPAPPGAAPLPAVDAGLHLCVRVDDLARERQLIEQAAAAGVELSPLSGFWLPDTPAEARAAGLVLGFAAVPEQTIGTALAALRQAWGAG